MKHVGIIPDLHAPYECPTALDAVERYLRDAGPWDYLVQLGDLVDLSQISQWSKDSPLELAKYIAPDLDHTKRVLDRWRGIVGDRCQIVITAGNHDDRLRKLTDRTPALTGLVELDRLLDLRARRIRWVESYPVGELFSVGKLHFGHGWYTGVNAARKHAEQFGVNLVVGHVHSVSSYAVHRYGKGNTIGCWTMGCMCDLEPGYMGKRPSNWQHAFGEAWVRRDGNFNLITHVINDGVFTANGRTYRGRK